MLAHASYYHVKYVTHMFASEQWHFTVHAQHLSCSLALQVEAAGRLQHAQHAVDSLEQCTMQLQAAMQKLHTRVQTVQQHAIYPCLATGVCRLLLLAAVGYANVEVVNVKVLYA